MPVKKAAARKTAPKKISEKKVSEKKKPKLACGICGFAVTVDNVCGCTEEHPIICCGKKMVKKK